MVEKIVMESNNDGAVKQLEIKGELSVTVYDDSFSRVKIRLKPSDNKQYQFKAHPNMDKDLYSNDSILALKSSSKNYQLNIPTSILKWRFQTTDENYIPLSVNLWPSSSGGESTVPVEFEKKVPIEFSDILISIPIPGPAPVVGEVEGSCDFDSKKSVLYWRIPLIDNKKKTGSMEFTVPEAKNSQFFPVSVSFVSNKTLCPIEVIAAVDEKGTNIQFSTESNLSPELYKIENS